jgi:hypothetical protein
MIISSETHENGQQAEPLQRSETAVGWISRKNLSLRSRWKFFLDISFYKNSLSLPKAA